MLIIHHNDADGRCAAAIVAAWYPAPIPCRFFETDYKTPPPLDLIRPGEHVAIVDFSYKPDDMDAVIAKAGGPQWIIWIDHHATARDYGYVVPGLRCFTDKGPSGAELAWRHCFPDRPEPRIVTLIGDYDTWRLEMDGSTALRVALESEAPARDPSSDWWSRVLAGGEFHDSEWERLVVGGRAMIRFRDGLAASLGKGYGFDTTFHDLRCRFVNLYGMGSAAIGEDVLREYDAGLNAIWDGRQWTVGMYSVRDDVDCGGICKEHGGGGHKGAAGFVCDTLPFAPEAEKGT